jgi:hypothetical protein
MLRAELLPPADAANVRNLLTASPDAPPHGLLPNMSESSGTPGENALGVLSPQCFPSRALPGPHSGDDYRSGRGVGVEQKTFFGSISSSGELSR